MLKLRRDEGGVSMFNPLKAGGNIKKLFQLQQEVKKIEVETAKGRAEVIVSGELRVKSVKLNGEELHDVKDALNEAFEKVQKKVAAKMQEMGGGLGGLLS